MPLSSPARLLLLTGLLPSLAHAAPEPRPLSPLFDPNRHMRVSEVKEGMKGYGLSVFHGTKIERFDVEVVSILRSFNSRQDGLGPTADVVLVRCSGQNLEHTGGIAGMSGSPIFLTDGQGRSRMIGAFAYGWPMAKDPIGGVQPIEYMLALPTEKHIPSTQSTTRPATQDTGTSAARATEARTSTPSPLNQQSPITLSPLSWSYPEFKQSFLARHGGAERGAAPRPLLANPTQLQPLACPLAASGFPNALSAQFTPYLERFNLLPLQSAASAGPSGAPPAPIEPGSVLAVPLLTGDMDLTAIGTCTEVLGNRVYGFGHPFNNEGDVSLPMGSGEIHAVIANLVTSFKMGALTQVRGTLNTDETVGIAGQIGASPGMIPLQLHVQYADGSEDRTYNLKMAAHPRLTPMITALAVAGAINATRELPQYHTLDYDLTMDFANGDSVRLNNELVNTSPADMLFAIGLPVTAAADNPFERVMVKQVKGTLRITPEAREAKILSVQVPKQRHKPGDTVRAYVTYRPFRAPEAILPVDFELPKDLLEGKYQLQISDAETYLDDEQTTRPFRFTAQSGPEVFAVLREIAAIKTNALYVRLMRDADGVAIGRTALPRLPGSRRKILLSANRSDITPFASSKTKTIPTTHVMQGSAVFEIEVESGAKVEGSPSRTGPSRDRHPTQPPTLSPPGNPPAKGQPPKDKPSPPGLPGSEEP